MHPEHEDIVARVLAFDHGAVDAMGYRSERRVFGTFWNLDLVRTQGFDPGRVPEFLEEVAEHYEGRPVGVHLTEGDTSGELADALVAHGCTEDDDRNLTIAHVGEVPDAPRIDGASFEPVDEANLVEAVETKLLAFSAGDAVDEDALAFDLRLRRGELSGIGAGVLARVDGEPASVLFCHDDPAAPDVSVFLLGTRPAHAGRRLGERLLVERIALTRSEGRRTTLINVFASNDRAVALYRRLGFTDVVSSRRILRFDPRR